LDTRRPYGDFRRNRMKGQPKGNHVIKTPLCFNDFQSTVLKQKPTPTNGSACVNLSLGPHEIFGEDRRRGYRGCRAKAATDAERQAAKRGGATVSLDYRIPRVMATPSKRWVHNWMM
jgi:hypothetical protein